MCSMCNHFDSVKLSSERHCLTPCRTKTKTKTKTRTTTKTDFELLSFTKLLLKFHYLLKTKSKVFTSNVC